MSHLTLLLALAPTFPAQDDEPFVEEGVYQFQIAEQPMGQEEVWFTANGWSCMGNFEIPGLPATTYEARRTLAEDGALQWELDVDAAGTEVRIEAVFMEGVLEGSIEPQGIARRIELDADRPVLFFENLVWSCFSDLGRQLASQASAGDLRPGFLVTALLTQAEQTFDFRVEEFSQQPQEVDGKPVPLWFFDLTSVGGQVMRILATPDGIPLSIRVPSQQLHVFLKGHEHLRMPGSEPITIVDRGPWRDSLSQPQHEVHVEKGVMVPMRDAVKLAADVYRPGGDGKHPAILVRTPYNRAAEGMGKGAFYARRGYALIAQDVRGRFDSEGDWFPLRHETDDGSDTIDWIASQPWCDGNVGMIGGSYVGWVQWYAAKSGNPHLKAIVPQVSPPDPDQNIPYEGGVFLLSSGWWATVLEHMEAGGSGLPDLDFEEVLKALPLSALDDALGTTHPFLDEWLAHPPVDPYWDPVRYQTHHGEMDVAALHVTGWYDGDQPGALQNFPAMRRQAKSERARQGQFLVVGPWGHAFNITQKMGEVDFGDEALVDLDSVYLRFFDRYLKGIENGMEEEDPVLVFVMRENTWHRERDWPLPQTQFTRLYLDSDGAARLQEGDGRLGLEEPDGDPAHDDYRYDPLDVPDLDLDFNDVTGAQATADQSTVADREDDLDYLSPPLLHDCEITGPVELVLHVSSDALDTDFAVGLLRVTPEGQMFNLAGGIQRMRYRNGQDEPVPPGEVVEVRVDCWATGTRLSKGDRLHLKVGSSAFPGYARNLGTLENPATATEPVIATNRVHHGKSSASYLILPVVPRDGAPALVFDE